MDRYLSIYPEAGNSFVTPDQLSFANFGQINEPGYVAASVLGGDYLAGGSPAFAADIVPGDTTSTATITPGSNVAVTIDTSGDHDWYAVTLEGGQTYTFSTISGTLSDTVLTLRDAAGTQLDTNDDANSSVTFSEITFTATSSGTYFLDVSGYGPDSGVADLTVTAPVADAIAASSATTATLTIGALVDGTMEAAGDHDWYAVALTAGTRYVFTTSATGGAADPDTTLFLRSASGALLGYNDDFSGTYSRIVFTPTTDGTYYLDIGAWGNAESGTYRIQMDNAPALAVYTYDQIATQLTNTYWGGTSRHWNVGPGGTITVNLTGLTADGQFLAHEALGLWTDATGIVFSEVAVGGQIVFDDDQAGGFANSTRVGGFITAATVNVGTDWLTSYGVTLRTYSFQTYVHEIGHALGLGHAGPYNGSANYPADATYLNDSWATTIMSYFDQTENTYFQSLGFTRQYAVSPMLADLVAVSNLYGTNTLTRTDNTTYGFGNTSGRDIFTAAVGQPSTSFTIVDNGGTDSLDYSGYSSTQLIDLNSETFSNIGGRVGNVSIARGTVIENAVGGSGSDTIIGNAADNVLTGNGGADTISGGGGNDSLEGDAGSDTLDGGTGTSDEAAYLGNRADYLVEYVTLNGVASVRVTGQGARVGDGVDVLTNIEFLKFADQRIAADGTPVNQHPVLSQALPDQVVFDGAAYTYQVPAGAFSDPDGNALTFSATLADGSPLPAWLTFDAATRTLNGTPPVSAVGTLQVKIVSSDNTPGDPSSFASDIFALQVYQASGPNIVGTAGNDVLTGTFRVERLYGLDGDDTFMRSPGPDYYDGGAGFDTVDYSGYGTGVSVNLFSQNYDGAAVISYFVSIEGLRGTPFNDTLTGNDLVNTLIGDGGDDVLIGNGGKDTLSGGAGDDRLVVNSEGSGSFVDGGADFDTLAISNFVSLGSIAGIEAIELAGGANLTLTTSQVMAGLAPNTQVSGSGTVTVNMDAGTYFFATQFTNQPGADVSFAVNGSTEIDVIKSALGNVITAHGGDSPDQIRGGNLADSIFGDGGNDKIMGLGGADQLTGGTGADQFRYLFTTDSGLGVNADRILDFTNGEDKLDFRVFDADPVAPGSQTLSFVGNSAFAANGTAQVRYGDSGADTLVQIDLDGNGVADMQIVLAGHAGQALAGTDFLF